MSVPRLRLSVLLACAAIALSAASVTSASVASAQGRVSRVRKARGTRSRPRPPRNRDRAARAEASTSPPTLGRANVWDTARLTTRPRAGTAEGYTFLATAMGLKRLAELNQNEPDLSARKLVFASLITDEPGKNVTVGNAGLILEAKPSNVIGNHPSDTAWYLSEGSRRFMSTADIADRVRKQYPPANGRTRPYGTPFVLHDPATLLEQTHGNNEVLLAGTAPADGATLRASAVFIRTDKDGNDLANAKEVAAFTEAAERWGVPVVRIPKAR